MVVVVVVAISGLTSQQLVHAFLTINSAATLR